MKNDYSQWTEIQREDYHLAFFDRMARFKKRADWKALKPKRMDKPLEQPVPFVVFSSIEVTGEDRGLPNAEVVRRIQERDMSLGMSDIQCNFLVTGDGTVWEGRGWDARPGCDEDYPAHRGRFVEITAIGNFTDETPRMALLHFIDIGVMYEYIDKAYEQLTPDKRRTDFVKCPFEEKENAKRKSFLTV